MDILIHTASGMLMGSTMAAINPFQVVQRKRQWLVSMLVGGLAGAFPDLDAISKWSRFDSTIGRWFDLASGNEVYTGRWWYSHHAFTHSLLASLIFGLVAFYITRLVLSKSVTRKRTSMHMGFVVFLGWTAHLVGDLPTPRGAWDGIAYFWPSSVYIGGTGQTFWWNNYDVFLLLILCLLLHALLMLIKKVNVKWGAALLTLSCILVIIVQLHNRPIDFNDRSIDYSERERISLEYQRTVLGDTLFQWMCALDAKLPVYF